MPDNDTQTIITIGPLSVIHKNARTLLESGEYIISLQVSDQNPQAGIIDGPPGHPIIVQPVTLP